MNRDRTPSRRSWLAENLYLLTGLLVGLGLGLLYAWVISPVKYVDTSPASLRADFKDGYRAVIASAYLAIGNIERAQSRLALLGDPDPVQALIDQAQQARSQGDPTHSANALSLLAEALQQPPTVPPTETPVPQPEATALPPEPTADLALEAYQRGFQLQEDGQIDQAIAAFDEAIQLNPNYIEAYYRRGVSKIDNGDYEGALADFAIILNLDANSPLGFNGRGIVNGIQGNFEEAIQDFNQAINLNPDYAEAYANRGIVYGNINNIEAALADFSKAIELHPENITNYYYRALAYASLGQTELAIADFRKVLKESENEEQRTKAQEFITALGGVP